MRFPWTSLAVSLAAHLLVIALIFFGGMLMWEKATATGGSGGTGGETVTVWISGPDGSPFPRSAGPSDMSSTAETMPVARVGDGAASPSGEKSSGSGGGMGGGDAGGAGGADGDDKVLAEIWKKIDRNKYYPSIAKRMQIEGSPRVTFEITGDGGINWVRLSSSSGNDILDDAAMETIRRATPLPYYPKPVTLAVKYSMDE